LNAEAQPQTIAYLSKIVSEFKRLNGQLAFKNVTVRKVAAKRRKYWGRDFAENIGVKKHGRILGRVREWVSLSRRGSPW